MTSINRKISAPMVRLLTATTLTPNQITFWGLVSGIISAAFFSMGGYLNCLLGAALFQLSYTLDNCDGELARLKNMKTNFGRYFDVTSDFVVYTALFSGITIGLYKTFPQDRMLILFGMLSLIGVLSSFFVCSDNSMGNKAVTGDFSFILFGFSIFSAMRLFLIVTSIGANIFWLFILLRKQFLKGVTT